MVWHFSSDCNLAKSLPMAKGEFNDLEISMPFSVWKKTFTGILLVLYFYVSAYLCVCEWVLIALILIYCHASPTIFMASLWDASHLGNREMKKTNKKYKTWEKYIFFYKFQKHYKKNGEKYNKSTTYLVMLSNSFH